MLIGAIFLDRVGHVVWWLRLLRFRFRSEVRSIFGWGKINFQSWTVFPVRFRLNSIDPERGRKYGRMTKTVYFH